MIFAYLIIMLLVFSMAVLMKKGDLMSPWLLSIMAFLASISLAASQQAVWKVKYSPLGILVISTAVLAWGFGDFMAGTRNFPDGPESHAVKKRGTWSATNEICINPVILFSMLVFVMLTTYSVYKQVYRVSQLAGNSSDVTDLSSMLYYGRIAMTYSTDYANEAQFPAVVVQMQDFSQALAIFCLFVFLYNTINFGYKKRNLIYTLIAVAYAVQTVLSTGRLLVLELLIIAFSLAVLLMRNKKGYSASGNSLVLRYILISVIGFVALFYLMGFLSGKSAGVGLISNVAWYGGGSIPALDHYLNNLPPADTQFGGETLIPLYNISNKLGLTNYLTTVHLDFIAIDDYPVNIYTSLRRYIQDYSFVGMYLIQITLGFVYGVFYRLLNQLRHGSTFSILLYSCFLFPVLLQALDEQFLMGIVSAPFVFSISYLILLYYLFVVRPQRRLNSPTTVGSTRGKGLVHSYIC